MYETEKRTQDTRLAGSSVDQIRESGPIGKAKETIGYLNELDSLLANVRMKLYGPFPQENASAPDKRTQEPCLEEMMHHICQRAAGISGDVKNLLSRLD